MTIFSVVNSTTVLLEKVRASFVRSTEDGKESKDLSLKGESSLGGISGAMVSFQLTFKQLSCNMESLVKNIIVSLGNQAEEIQGLPCPLINL